jgi:hypothetical protein
VTKGIEGLGLIDLEKAMDALLCKWVIKALKQFKLQTLIRFQICNVQAFMEWGFKVN